MVSGALNLRADGLGDIRKRLDHNVGGTLICSERFVARAISNNGLEASLLGSDDF